MALNRPVPTDFWINPKVNEEYSLDDKLLYIYLITNEHLQQLGIYKISKKIIAIELNMDFERLEKAFDNLENKFKVIKYSDKTNEIAILDYYSFGILKGGKPVENCFDNLGKKVSDFNLLKEMYLYSKSIIDEREIYSKIMTKLESQLRSLKMLDDEEEKKEEKRQDNYMQPMYDENPF